MKVGYARVSTEHQNIRMQIEQLEKYGCDKIFQEVESGGNPSRTQMASCIHFLRPGDTLVVCNIDRLARNKKHCDEILNYVDANGINLISINEGLDSKDQVGRLVLNILIAIAESERERSRERTKAGLAVARARGRLGGRSHKIKAKARGVIKVMYESKKYTLQEIAEMYNISKPTVYRYVTDKANDLNMGSKKGIVNA